MRVRLTTALTILVLISIGGAIVTFPLVFILAQFFGIFGRPEATFWTFLLLIPFAFAARVMAGLIERRLYPWLMWSGLLATALACAGWMISIWFPSAPLVDHWEAMPIRLATLPPTCWAALCIVMGFMGSTSARGPWARWLYRISLVLLFLLAIEVCGLTVAYPLYEHNLSYYQRERLVELAGRGSFLVGFIALGMLLVSAFLTRSTGLLDEAPGSSEGRHFIVQAACPRCGAWFRLASGGAACPGCGLEITVADA